MWRPVDLSSSCGNSFDLVSVRLQREVAVSNKVYTTQYAGFLLLDRMPAVYLFLVWHQVPSVQQPSMRAAQFPLVRLVVAHARFHYLQPS